METEEHQLEFPPGVVVFGGNGGYGGIANEGVGGPGGNCGPGGYGINGGIGRPRGNCVPGGCGGPGGYGAKLVIGGPGK